MSYQYITLIGQLLYVPVTLHEDCVAEWLALWTLDPAIPVRPLPWAFLEVFKNMNFSP